MARVEHSVGQVRSESKGSGAPSSLCRTYRSECLAMGITNAVEAQTTDELGNSRCVDPAAVRRHATLGWFLTSHPAIRTLANTQAIMKRRMPRHSSSHRDRKERLYGPADPFFINSKIKDDDSNSDTAKSEKAAFSILCLSVSLFLSLDTIRCRTSRYAGKN